MPDRKILVIGPQRKYPAFQSIIKIMHEIFTRKQIKIIPFESQLEQVPSVLRILIHLLQEIKIIVHLLQQKCDNSKPMVFIFQSYFPLVSIVSKILDRKLVYYIGGSAFKSSYYEGTSVIRKFLAFSNLLPQRICLSICDRILIPLSAMAKWLELDSFTDKIQPLIGIVDSQFFDKFRVLKPYPARENVIGFVGSLRKGKGVERLIESIHLIKSELNFTNFRLLIIGHGPIYSELVKKIKALHLETQVTLVGYVHHNKLPIYYNQMKLFTLFSYTEGLPSTLLESMACGTPILTTRVGAIPSIIDDYQNGLLVKTGNPSKIARKIVRLLEEKRVLEKISANSVKFVKSQFDYNQSLEKWRLLFETLE